MFVLVNGALIVLGAFAGILLKKVMDSSIQTYSIPIFAAITLYIGIRLVSKDGDASAVVLTVLLSFLIGESIHLEDKLELLSTKVISLFSRENQKLGENEIQYFISGFILTVCSTSGIVGAINLSLSGDYTILMTKALLDLLLILVYTMVVGPAIGVLAVPVWLLLGSVYGFTCLFKDILTEQMILNFSVCGGIIQLLNAMKMLHGKKVHAASLIPAIPLIFLVTRLLELF